MVVETEEVAIPSPSITLSATLYEGNSSQDYYVIVVGTIFNRHDKPLYPVKTELRLFFHYDSLYANKPALTAYGGIGFIKDGKLDYKTDTLRVGERMHHYTKTDGFFWGGGNVYYDFRIVVGGISPRVSGLLKPNTPGD